jgi:glycine/sarcosine N-methyltransferase
MRKTEQFCDSMADHYHLIFEYWDMAMRRQGAVIAELLPLPGEAGIILDAACGIGTQSLALAALGYTMVAPAVSLLNKNQGQRPPNL